MCLAQGQQRSDAGEAVCLINTLFKLIHTNCVKMCLINTLFLIINTNGMKYLVEKCILIVLIKKSFFRKRDSVFSYNIC